MCAAGPNLGLLPPAACPAAGAQRRSVDALPLFDHRSARYLTTGAMLDRDV